MSLTIGLVYDLRDDYLAEGWSPEKAAEFDSLSTIEAIESAIVDLGHQVERVGNGKRLCFALVAGRRWDLVFNIAEGVRGRSREAQVPALLEMYDIPYTFSDPLVCAATLDKAVAKRLVRDAGLNTPDFQVIDSEADLGRFRLEYPVFAKPVAEGTGIGIDRTSRIVDPAQLKEVCLRLLDRHQQPVLVEEYLPGREFTTGILGTGRSAVSLGTMEILIQEHAGTLDYSYEMKDRWREFVKYLPLDERSLLEQVEELALGAYRALECRDLGRVDLRMDRHGRPAFVEVNPLPGLNPVYSDLPMLARQSGWDFGKIIAGVIESAARRWGV